MYLSQLKHLTLNKYLKIQKYIRMTDLTIIKTIIHDIVVLFHG